MKRLTNRKSRLGFIARVYDKNGVEVQCIKKLSKKGFLYLLRGLPAREWHRIDIRVGYSKTMWNESEHYDLKSLEKALNAFTEKQILDYISN
jgi:hypothetical protein